MSYKTTVDNGHSDNRIDIVILGDGYQNDEFGTLEQHASSMTDYLFSTGGLLSDPFSRYKNFFNVHIVFTASNDSGTDDPTNSITKDTAFDTSYLYDGMTDRLLYGSARKADAAVSAEFSSTSITPEMLFMSVNSTKYGGGGGKYAVFAGGDANAHELALHELGHSFADLADEYYFDDSSYTGSEPVEANVTKDSSGDKWDHWIGYEQQDIGTIGVYEGGKYNETDIYRPSVNSKMKSLGQPFDIVSIEQFILKFYSIVDPLDNWTDNSQIVTGRKFIKVQPIDAEVIDVEWSVDGENLGLGDVTRVNLTKLGIAPGTMIDVAARAFDTTTWVRSHLEDLEMTVEWTANVPYYINQLIGTSSADKLTGVSWDDRIVGHKGNDRLQGLKGNDAIFGGNGRDKVFGGQGTDNLKGGNGNDVLTGGKGDDTLNGGTGADVFKFTGTGEHGADRIVGFQDGIDKIRLANSYDFDDLTLTTKNGGTLIEWDLGSVFLEGVAQANIAAVDFLF